MKSPLVSAVFFGGLLLVVLGPGIGFHNREVVLRNAISAQQVANEATFDRVWKVIQQQADVAEQHREAFAEIYGDMCFHGQSERILRSV